MILHCFSGAPALLFCHHVKLTVLHLQSTTHIPFPWICVENVRHDNQSTHHDVLIVSCFGMGPCCMGYVCKMLLGYGGHYFEGHLGVLVQERNIKHQPSQEVLHHRGPQLPTHWNMAKIKAWLRAKIHMFTYDDSQRPMVTKNVKTKL